MADGRHQAAVFDTNLLVDDGDGDGDLPSMIDRRGRSPSMQAPSTPVPVSPTGTGRSVLGRGRAESRVGTVVTPTNGWVLEPEGGGGGGGGGGGSSGGASGVGPSTATASSGGGAGNSFYYKPAVENPDADLAWYEQYFAYVDHDNYVGVDDTVGPICVSAVAEIDETDGKVQYRGIVWLRTGKTQIIIHTDSKKAKKNPPLAAILEAAEPGLGRLAKKLRVANEAAVCRELLNIEDLQAIKHYKFGLLFARQGQTTEEEMFANDPSPELDRFLALVGTKIQLRGWDGYRAGLDVANGQTGEYSVFTAFRGYDLMFHVSALLPHDDTGQEVQRKRHIGNDIVVLVFVEGDTPFAPNCIDTQFIHIYFVVQPAGAGRYRLTVARRASVPAFGPALSHTVFDANQAFVDVLLTKMINAERAALRSPSFRDKYRRTQQTLLSALYDKAKGLKKVKRKASLPVGDVPRSRALRVGGASTSGDAAGGGDGEPTTVVGRRASIQPTPFEDKIFEARHVQRFEVSMECFETWGNNYIFSNASGLFVYSPRDGRDPWRVSKLACAELTVLESLGVLIARGSKKGYVYTFVLSSLQRGAEVRMTRLKGTKKAHIYAVGQPLTKVYLCVGVKKELLLFGWDKTGFLRETSYAIPVPCKVVQFMGKSLCVAFANEFDELELETGDVRELYVPSARVTPLDVLQVSDTELLLCYNNTGILVSRKGKVNKRFRLKWTSNPNGFAYSLPFVLAVTPKYVEVRTMLNGNLIQTIELPPPVRLLSAKKGLFVAVADSEVGVTTVYEIKPNVSTTLSAIDALGHDIVGDDMVGDDLEFALNAPLQGIGGGGGGGGPIPVESPPIYSTIDPRASDEEPSSVVEATTSATSTGGAGNLRLPTDPHLRDPLTTASSMTDVDDEVDSQAPSRSADGDAESSGDDPGRARHKGKARLERSSVSGEHDGSDPTPPQGGSVLSAAPGPAPLQARTTIPDPADLLSHLRAGSAAVAASVEGIESRKAFEIYSSDVHGGLETLLLSGGGGGLGDSNDLVGRLAAVVLPQHVRALFQFFTPSIRSEDVPFDTARLDDSLTGVLDGVTLITGSANIDDIISGTRSTLLGVKALKQMLDAYASAAASAGRFDDHTALSDTTRTIQSLAANLVLATRAFGAHSEAAQLGELQAVGRTLGEAADAAFELILGFAFQADVATLQADARAVVATVEARARTGGSGGLDGRVEYLRLLGDSLEVLAQNRFLSRG